ncbi:PilZ domain-containing protein [Spartinivicinus poritis]|uniref:PilZ domain-containing protein n=1 Tax=Spartinivicinus poritis TaxID=2994640 RepID=A0ABT5UKE8_9GAMM|nr:PilZ domain-containing protein [Spartinivicinus sp. A2-2]MDE1465957.1 PilZ domain-containing protein [Spartinivicinus sp. A2-2]
MTENIEDLVAPQQEHRRFVRRDVKWKVVIKDKARNIIVDAMTINVSEQGTLIATNEAFKKQQIFPLMIQARIQEKKLKIYTMAEVRHIVIKKDFFQLGVLFKQIRPNDQKLLSRFAENII